MTARDLVFEIGTEELPVSFVKGAIRAWPSLSETAFRASRLSHQGVHVMGTPRRLVLCVRGLVARQADLKEQVQGPPRQIAYDKDGSLSRAGKKFIEKLGVSEADLETVTTPKGKYIAARRHEPGRETGEVLRELLPKLAAQIPFPKMMRWGDGQVAFGRPVQWLLALLGDEVVDIQFAEIVSDRYTRGHRFLANEQAEVRDATQYAQVLAEKHVLLDGKARETVIGEQLLRAASVLDAELIPDPELIEECAYLVEEPHVVSGTFDAQYLELPEEVIVALMRGHQRYFAVRDPEGGGLMPHYLTVANTAVYPEMVSQGNNRVLGARLQDARFFVHEDQKRTLAERVDRLESIVFQAQLGSVGAKVHRLSGLVSDLVSRSGATEETRSVAQQAAGLSKADLLTLMVGEFPELQGVMGRFYALKEGLPPLVAEALYEQYLPKGAGALLPTTHAGAILALADRLDSLVGCFGVGVMPDGSVDPFALRRATLGIIRIALHGPMDVDWGYALGAAYDRYDAGTLRDRAGTLKALDAFGRARLRALYTADTRADIVDACLSAWQSDSFRDLDERMRALVAFCASPNYGPLLTAFKRVFNITKGVSPMAVDRALLTVPAEIALAEAFFERRATLDRALQKGAYANALEEAMTLLVPIDRFFEEVFVMDENPDVKANRLHLLANIAHTLTHIADFRALEV
ncbi:MAG: glycine--tRNA ligase subunit beta [Myxococcales bacterium]|nr:glycine--tRNA ligase subunit beta [Myxococcales bacterium]